jgi:hypothetical protein
MATTTGSIDAKLTVDDSDFKRGMTEAKAEAKEVGELEPKVKVDANVGPALAKLEAVAKAERDLDIAFQRSTIAQEKLDTVTQKYGEDSIQAASARLALTRATNAESDAQAKHAGLLARDSEEQDKNTESTKAGVRANRDRVSGLQVLLALAPEILAAAAPIAGAATGLAVGFGVMGLAGVFAVKGIKDAMQVGDQVGNQYAASIQGLKTDMNTLGATSANAMLSSFNQIIGDINTRMPFLNTLIGNGAVGLGQMGGTAMRGVLDGLQTMNPLIQQGQVELGKFVGWLFSFNGTTGFKDFIGYSMDNLPSVMHLLENLVITAGHILSAYAPLGPVMITLLNGLTDGLNSLPLPVLAGLVTTGTLLGPALKTAFAPGVSTLIISVAEAIGYTGVMANLAVPVVGVLTALIAGIGIAAATSAMGTHEGTDAFVDYGNAIEKDNGLLGENTRLQAAHAATTKEMRDAADSLGISTMVVIQAMLGDKDAQQQVNDKMSTAIDRRQELRRGDENLTDTSLRLKAAKDTLSDGIDKNSTAITNNLDTYNAYQDAVAAGTNKTDAQSQALMVQANQYGTTVAAIKSAQDAEDKTGQSTADTTTKMQLQNDAAGLLKMTLDGLNGKAISAAQAQNSFDSSLANMGDHVDKTGKKIHFTTTSIDDMSAASVALRGQLNTQVSGLQAVVEANGGLDDSTGKAKEQMEAMRTQIIDNAVAHGVDKDAVTAYVDNLLTIPKSVPPTKVDIDKEEAEKKLRGFQSAINSLTGKTVDIYSVTHIQEVRDGPAVNGISGNAIANSMDAANRYTQDNAYNHADGGEILYRAGGGGVPFRPSGTDTVPAMLTPGEVVMNRMSVDSLGLGNLLQANRTGQWPEQNGGPVTINLVLDGQIIDTRIVDLTNQTISGVSRQIGGMRR